MSHGLAALTAALTLSAGAATWLGASTADSLASAAVGVLVTLIAWDGVEEFIAHHAKRST